MWIYTRPHSVIFRVEEWDLFPKRGLGNTCRTRNTMWITHVHTVLFSGLNSGICSRSVDLGNTCRTWNTMWITHVHTVLFSGLKNGIHSRSVDWETHVGLGTLCEFTHVHTVLFTVLKNGICSRSMDLGNTKKFIISDLKQCGFTPSTQCYFPHSWSLKGMSTDQRGLATRYASKNVSVNVRKLIF